MVQSQSNVVFLIDVNSVCSKKGRGDPELTKQVVVKTEGDQIVAPASNKSQPLEELPFKKEWVGPKFWNEDFAWLKNFILLKLFKHANTGENYDYSKVQWTFKFYDSTRNVDNKDGKAFMPFDNNTFTNFEAQLDQRMVNCTASSVETKLGGPLKCLSDALKAVTGSLPWPEVKSLDRSVTEDSSEISFENVVYVFSKVPRCDRDFSEFSGLHPSSSSREFTNLLLPQAFSHKFHHRLGIKLCFLDMNTAPENIPSTPGRALNFPAVSKQIVRCLHYLGGGRVEGVFNVAKFDAAREQYHFGLIPYYQYLRLQLQNKTAQIENSIPSHVLRFAPATVKANHSQKISPEFDTASVSRSTRIGSSVLDASTNSQNKVLRPLRVSTGFVDEEDQLEFHRKQYLAIKEQDQIRERDGERKRKRLDYEHDSYYHNHDFGHDCYRSGDMSYGSSDVGTSSQVEKEQRLESWIIEGSFQTKRKKHPDVKSSAVPMSRVANLNKQHIFHEPAPKLPGTRGKKMMAAVERQKQKVAANEFKRRSNEGFDLKRISYQHEKELSAVKRRLKRYLELEEYVEPLEWLSNYRQQLRSFANNIIDTDEEPSLVPLAQALVNNVAIQLGRQRSTSIKVASKSSNLSVKDMLQDILLIDFTNLNKKIIMAHEENSRGDINNMETLKILAFRETELQILLRLEIAWYYVEPSEEETKVLLIDIVRLLQIIAAYRISPPVDHFVNTVILPTYHQISRFMRALYRRMNIPLPPQLTIDGSPVAGASRREDDSSVISSTSSFNLCPEDSASQLQMHKPKRTRVSPSVNTNRAFGQYSGSGRKPNSNSKKVKRQIYVSNPKLPATSNYGMDRTDSHGKAGGANAKVSPKRVRRNLFDVQKKDKKDSKTLLSLSYPSKPTRSPAFKSPKGKSPLSGLGFFRAARNFRRQPVATTTTANKQLESPCPDSDVLCPESPATPGDRFSMCSSKYAAGSGEKKDIVLPSPEVFKTEYENRPIATVASLSFYSSGNAASKSRAWEKSEARLMAARIKDSVDLRSVEEKGLSLNDLEIISNSPSGNENATLATESLDATGSRDTSGTNVSLCPDSLTEFDKSLFSSSETGSPLIQFTGPAPDLNNPNIEALITRGTFPIPLVPMPTIKEGVPLSLTQRSIELSPSATTTTACPNNILDTPSKRVQFNLNENLINTPSRRSSGTGTPKSILKEAHDV